MRRCYKEREEKGVKKSTHLLKRKGEERKGERFKKRVMVRRRDVVVKRESERIRDDCVVLMTRTFCQKNKANKKNM